MNPGSFFRRTRVLLGSTALLAAFFLFVISNPAQSTSAQASKPDAASQPSSAAQQQSAPQPQVSAAPAVSIPSYPDSPSGLESLVKEMMRLVKAGDHQTFDAYAKSLELPNADAWYKSTFGDASGGRLFAATDRARTEFALGSWDMMQDLQKHHRTQIEATRFDKSCDDRATSFENAILQVRDSPDPLYDVRFSGGGTTSVWTYFAYVNGAFRYLGSFRWDAGSTKTGTAATAKPPVQVNPNVQVAKLIHMVQPKYPTEAKHKGIQGKVVFHAIIGKDGTVNDLVLLEGACELAEPAREALKQWVYKPTIVNGEPVEVDTTITVVFTLGG